LPPLNFAALGSAISRPARKPLSQRRLRLFSQETSLRTRLAFICGFAAVDQFLQARSGGFHAPQCQRSAGGYCAGEHFIIDLQGAKRPDDIEHIATTRR